MTVTTPPGSVGFLVVGSPRSGTTLVQRLACEIPGVGMPPETHFFSDFAAGLVTDHRFPLKGRELTDAVRNFAEAESSSGLDVDVDAVLVDMAGICLRPFDLFEALVRHLTGPAEIRGEKTPNHLVWWRPISVAAPWMRFVAVVRDPRAVVASNLEMPWRTDPTLPPWGDHMHLAFAELWRFFQNQVLAMGRALGPERCLVVRYEDVVKDPAATRVRLARFLDRPTDGSAQTAPAGIVLPWESWKAQALDPVADDRVTVWREQLDRRRATDIAAICRKPMVSFDYTVDVPPWWAEAATGARLGPVPWLRLARYARARRLRLRAIERYRL
jgi:Sulfotransferase family